MLPVKAPRDPAPSRIKYRLERLWLRPAIRNSVRIGLPLAALAWMLVSLALNPVVQKGVADKAMALRNQIAAHPGLMVKELRLNGVSGPMQARIIDHLELELPVSSMDLDLGAVQRQVTALDAVASAQVRLEGAGVLGISVTERVPVLLWRRTDGALNMLDENGVFVGLAESRAERVDLPIIAGDGADKAVAEARELLALSEPIAGRLRGLVRVGERRWTLVLNTGLRILLPETGATAALARVMALHEAEDILSRELARVDMRDRRRPILQLTPESLRELRRAQGIIIEEDV
ncbi:cell division protein FtsQ/DivIB [Oceanibium sediminis]|uniref:cell division protein FtsQ/DivIB n=1 Tax=Oceanibium sediminis TaxID=2026339 RepID=UPI000DD3A821|nr:cell division protein FtsQ/DivIB [Oceanibium sediminis]